MKSPRRSESLKVYARPEIDFKTSPVSAIADSSNHSTHSRRSEKAKVSSRVSSRHSASKGSQSTSMSSGNVLSDGGSSCDTPPRKTSSKSSRSSLAKVSPDREIQKAFIDIPIDSSQIRKMKPVESDIISELSSSPNVPFVRKMTPTKTRTISKSNHSSSTSSVRSIPLNDVQSYQNRSNVSAKNSSLSEVSSGLNAFEEETLSKWNNEIDHFEAEIPSKSITLPKFDHLESLKSNTFSQTSITREVKNIDLTPSRPAQIRRVRYLFSRLVVYRDLLELAITECKSNTPGNLVWS